MKKSFYFPLLLGVFVLQGCTSSADTAVNTNNTLSAFLSVHAEYCDAKFSSPAVLQAAISKDAQYKSIKDYNGIYEKVIADVSYAVSPEKDGCTTDFKLKVSEQDKAYFGFDQFNKKLLSEGYTLKGKKSIHNEMGLDNEVLQVIEQKYISPNDTVTTLLFPLERESQYFMTLFADKYGMEDASIENESEINMFEI